jgi:hypothetical protein
MKPLRKLLLLVYKKFWAELAQPVLNLKSTRQMFEWQMADRQNVNMSIHLLRNILCSSTVTSRAAMLNSECILDKFHIAESCKSKLQRCAQSG